MPLGAVFSLAVSGAACLGPSDRPPGLPFAADLRRSSSGSRSAVSSVLAHGSASLSLHPAEWIHEETQRSRVAGAAARKRISELHFAAGFGGAFLFLPKQGGG